MKAQKIAKKMTKSAARKAKGAGDYTRGLNQMIQIIKPGTLTGVTQDDYDQHLSNTGGGGTSASGAGRNRAKAGRGGVC